MPRATAAARWPPPDEKRLVEEMGSVRSSDDTEVDGQIRRIFNCRSEFLFELEDSAAYNLIVDLDIHAICANSQSTRA